MSSLGRVEVVEKGLKSSDLRLKTSKKLEKVLDRLERVW